MAEGPNGFPGGPSDSTPGAKKGSLANEQRLVALGQAVDRRAGLTPSTRHAKRHRGRNWAIVGLVVVGLIVAVVGGGYLYAQWRFSKITKVQNTAETGKVPGKPFNILMIGSDSRAGLSGLVAKQTGATSGAAAGQRSDVVKIVHVDPEAGTISMVSIPRDTMTSLVANQSLFGKFNRINVNFGNGPSLLTKTITADFGIPINDTIVVSFAGMINAAVAIGGVYLNFPYPAMDTYSGLRIRHPGCQKISGLEALDLVRSRHYQWYEHGVWTTDATSDFGRIWRQGVFLHAMVARAKGIYNPLTINSFLSKLPQGVALDQNFTLNDLIGLAVKFHSINPANILTYTLPVVPGKALGGQDVEFVSQPAAQELLVKIFGNELKAPTNPPPNTALQTPPPPKIAVPTTTTTVHHTTTTAAASKSTTTVHHTTTTVHHVTTTTVAPEGDQYFDPTVCTP